jgi:Ser/Thr protein kinase RdoA (MazF antagonist)
VGATNAVTRVDVDGETYFLRAYSRLSPPEVAAEHELIRHVASRGVPAPLPVARADGSTVVAVDGVAHALFESARGDQRARESLTDADARASGAMLARVHAATDGYQGAPVRPLWLDWDGEAWVRRLDRIAAAIEQLGHRSDLNAWAATRVASQRDWLADSACPHSYTPTFRSQLLHGDYQEANLFFDDAGVSGVIDWDNAVVFPRAYELVRACAFMFGVEPAHTAAFVDGYRSVAPLSEAELADGAAAWGCYSDHHVWALEETFLNGNAAAARFIPARPFVPFADAWRGAGVR